MLVLTRKFNESIVINGDIRITVVGIRNNQVRLGIEAPGQIKVFREELLAPKDQSKDENPDVPRRTPKSSLPCAPCAR
jgi:carbon storage regulator